MRTVREEHTVSEAIDLHCALYPRLEEAYEALTWTLAHRPEIGEIIDDFFWLYKQAGDEEMNVPALVVVYTFDADSVDVRFLLIRLPTL